MTEKKRKIAYDISILETESLTGVEKLCLNLFLELWKSAPEWEHTAFCRHHHERFNEFPAEVKIKATGGGRFWRYRELPKALAKENYELFISPVSALPWPCSIPMMAFIHECQWRHVTNEQKSFMQRLLVKTAIRRAKIILTISQFSRKEILAECGKRQPEIEIIYPSRALEKNNVSSEQSIEEIKKFFGIEGKYCLFVSSIRAKKNIDLLIEAFKRPEMHHLTLVLAGKVIDNSFPEKAREAGCSNVHFLGYTPDGIVQTLYENAECFIFASLNEGFGIPILEAFSYDCPVIASACASIPEVAGDAAIYLEEMTPEELSRQILRLSGDDALRTMLIERGRARENEFSWKKSAEKLKDIIRLKILK